jgi:hypothetical protein
MSGKKKNLEETLVSDIPSTRAINDLEEAAPHPLPPSSCLDWQVGKIMANMIDIYGAFME